MNELATVKKITGFYLIFTFAAFLLTFQSCIKKRSEMANELFKQTHNPIFKDADTDSFRVVFKKVLAEQKHQLKHADFIADYYRRNHYQPVIVLNHMFNGDLDKVTDYLNRAGEHGLNPEIFRAKELSDLVNQLSRKNSIKTLDEAYHEMAEVELNAASSLISYSNALQYGVINPKYIYERYFMTVKRPDTAAMSGVFRIGNMQRYLDSIQPKDPQYIALQNFLKNGLQPAGLSAEETKRIILVNLERLRWRDKPLEDRYVIVNVPDYMLNVVDSGKSVLKMKVCVGQGRNPENKNTLEAYNDTCKVDKPGEHETPLLNSLIYGVEVNPVWNIPKSIANKEIIVAAAKDKLYLSNANIDVYKNGKLVDDPESIDWTKITKENLPYDFKQKPGTDNSLGVIKFMFDNESNVYLHDTPVKSAFSWKMRAVSHGCVRLGDPKGLALSLFGQGNKFKMISDDMGKDNPDPTSISLPKKVPVYITYVTCWADENKVLQFRNDIYGLDIVLYEHLKGWL